MGKFIYGGLMVLGIVLTIASAVYAYGDRGYFAVGGEYSFLLLPLFGLAIDCMMQDHIDEADPKEVRFVDTGTDDMR